MWGEGRWALRLRDAALGKGPASEGHGAVAISRPLHGRPRVARGATRWSATGDGAPVLGACLGSPSDRVCRRLGACFGSL
jgi:hypothetical protein